MNVPIFGKLLDERFFDHRRRSTSIAGVVGGVLAILLFAYRFYIDHIWSWDLFAVGATVAGVKVVLMIWFYLTD